MPRETNFGGEKEYNMPKITYYEVLGVGRNATVEEIKIAYRERAKETHPDKPENRDTEEKFKDANEAYQILSDPQKRKVYDLGLSGLGFEKEPQGGRLKIKFNGSHYVLANENGFVVSFWYEKIEDKDEFFIGQADTNRYYLLDSSTGQRLGSFYQKIEVVDGKIVGYKNASEKVLLDPKTGKEIG